MILFVIITLMTSCITTDRVISTGCNCDNNIRVWSHWNSPYLYNPWLYDLGWNSNWWFYDRYPRYYNRNTPPPTPPSRYDRRRNSTPRTVTPSQPKGRYYDDNVYPQSRPTHRVPMTPSPRYSPPSNNTPSRNNQNRTIQPSQNNSRPSTRSGRGGIQ